MKFCTNCGKQLEDDSLFCTGCGTKFQENTEENPVPETAEGTVPAFEAETPVEVKPATEPQPVPETPKKKSKKGLIFGLLGGLLGIALLALAIWFFTKPAFSWRMSVEEVKAAVEQEFTSVYLDEEETDGEADQWLYYDVYDEELGDIDLRFGFTYNQLTYIYISTDVSEEKLRRYCEKELDTYLLTDNDDYMCISGDTLSYIFDYDYEYDESEVVFYDFSASSLEAQESVRRTFEDLK